MKNSHRISFVAPFREPITVSVSANPQSAAIFFPVYQQGETARGTTTADGSMSSTRNLLARSSLQTWSSAPPVYSSLSAPQQQQQQQQFFESSFTPSSPAPRLLVPIRRGVATFALESICLDLDDFAALQRNQAMTVMNHDQFSFRITFYVQTTPGWSKPIALCTLDPTSKVAPTLSHHFAPAELGFSSNVLFFALVRRKFLVRSKQQQQQQQSAMKRRRKRGDDDNDNQTAQLDADENAAASTDIIRLRFHICGNYYTHVRACDVGSFENRHTVAAQRAQEDDEATADDLTYDHHFGTHNTRNDLLPVLDRVFGNKSQTASGMMEHRLNAKDDTDDDDDGGGRFDDDEDDYYEDDVEGRGERRRGAMSSVSSSSLAATSDSSIDVDYDDDEDDEPLLRNAVQRFRDRHFVPASRHAPGAMANRNGNDSSDEDSSDDDEVSNIRSPPQLRGMQYDDLIGEDDEEGYEDDDDDDDGDCTSASSISNGEADNSDDDESFDSYAVDDDEEEDEFYDDEESDFDSDDDSSEWNYRS